MNKTISSKNNTLKIKVHNYFKYNKYKLSSPDYKKKIIKRNKNYY